MNLNEGTEAHCVSQACMDTEENIFRRQHLRNSFWELQLQNIHSHACRRPCTRLSQVFLGQRKPFSCLPSHAWKMVGLKGNKMLGQRTPVQRGPERTGKEKDPITDATYGALSLCPALSSQRSSWVTATVITKTDGSPQTEGSMATFLRYHRNRSLSPTAFSFRIPSSQCRWGPGE